MQKVKGALHSRSLDGRWAIMIAKLDKIYFSDAYGNLFKYFPAPETGPEDSRDKRRLIKDKLILKFRNLGRFETFFITISLSFLLRSLKRNNLKSI